MSVESVGRTLSAEQGEFLIRLARSAIRDRFGEAQGPGSSENDPPREPDADLADLRCGTFVTLTIDDRLRGCIGTFSDTEPLPVSIRNNAVNAAFGDPRFSPLKRTELDRIRIEVSVLSPPTPLQYDTGEDLQQKLTPEVDGVIIRKDAARATFLPQVWKQLPRPEDFLSHLCLKAGLPADIWKREKLNVEIYNVQYFEEEEAI